MTPTRQQRDNDWDLWRGSVNVKLDRVIKDLEDERESASAHRQALRDVIGALSQSVNTLAENVRRMEPIVADYRDKASEARGAAKFGKLMWAFILGAWGIGTALIGALVGKKF